MLRITHVCSLAQQAHATRRIARLSMTYFGVIEIDVHACCARVLLTFLL